MKPNTSKQSKAVELKPVSVPTVAEMYADVLAVVKAHLDSKAVETAEKQSTKTGKDIAPKFKTMEEVEASVLMSMSLWFLGNGYGPDVKVDQDTKEALKASWAVYGSEVTAGMKFTRDGREGKIVGFGKFRYTGFENHLPNFREGTVKVKERLTLADQETFARGINDAMERAIAQRRLEETAGK